jgi:hypothetical protein
MKSATTIILVTVIIAGAGAYYQGWQIKPLVTYQMLYTTTAGTPPPVFWDSNTNIPIQVYAKLDNDGGISIVTDITVTAINATILSSQKGPFGQSSTVRALIKSKDGFVSSFQVIPFDNASSFQVTISNVQTVNGNDQLANLIYFVFSSSIYTPVNLTTLTYVRLDQSSQWNPQT